MSSRKPGSDQGRPSIDWEDAFTFYASLPAAERCYQAVADEYGVSVRTVERHGRDEQWKRRLREVHADAAARNDERLAEERAAQRAAMHKLIEASLTTFATKLRAGDVRMATADLQRLFRLSKELAEEDAAATQHARSAALATEPADEQEMQARKLEIARALHDAGVLTRLQQLFEPPTDDMAAERGVEEAT